MMELEIRHHRAHGTAHATPLLFVHGAFSDARIWEKHFLPYFAQQGYEALALSLRGHGASEGKAQLWHCRLSDYVTDVAQVVATLPKPPVLIGHSMGGMVIQKYAEEHPFAIAGVVLMASVPPQGILPCMQSMMLRHPLLFQYMCAFSVFGPKSGSPEMMRRLLFSEDIPETDLREYFGYTQAESLRVSMDMLWHPIKSHPLQAPTLVLGAQKDTFVPVESVEATARFYHTKRFIFPQMAHAMMLETRWREVADRLSEWLKSSE